MVHFCTVALAAGCSTVLNGNLSGLIVDYVYLGICGLGERGTRDADKLETAVRYSTVPSVPLHANGEQCCMGPPLMVLCFLTTSKAVKCSSYRLCCNYIQTLVHFHGMILSIFFCKHTYLVCEVLCSAVVEQLLLF